MKLTKAVSSLSLILVFAFASTVGNAQQPAESQGKAPEKFYWIDIYGGPSEFVFPFIECDGFGTVMTATLQGFWMYHPETPGRGGWEFFHSAYPTSIANADDPSIYVNGIPGQVINRHWSGEPFASDPIETGVQLMITLPGYGVVYRDVGRLRLDWDTFEPEFLAGHWDSFDEDYQALCAALAP